VANVLKLFPVQLKPTSAYISPNNKEIGCWLNKLCRKKYYNIGHQGKLLQ
jgi:hypothetical protein